MADYLGLQQYRTLDGRTVGLPPQFAGSFAGLTPVEQEPSVPEAPPMQAPQPSAGLTPPVPVDERPLPEAPAAPPVTTAPAVPAAQSAESPRSPSPAPAARSDSAPAASSPPAAPPPQNDAALSQVGYSGVLREQTAALEQAAQAGRSIADAQAKEATAVADAFQARNAELQRMEAERQKAIADRAAQVQQARLDSESATKAYAEHKVSREMQSPVLGALSLILGAVGSAIAGKAGENPALTVLQQQMDKNVQLQLAERDKLKDVAAMKRTAIDSVRAAADDRIQQYTLAMAGETERAMRQVEEIKTRSSSDIVKANADKLLAELAGKRAEYLDQAVTRRIDLDDKRAAREQQAKQAAAQLGLGYAQLGEQRAQRLQQGDQFAQNLAFQRESLDKNLVFQREKEENDLKVAAMNGKGAAAKAAQKENDERGIRDPATGELLVTKKGQALRAQAKTADEEAAKWREQASRAGNDQTRASLEMRAKDAEERASMLRVEADTNHAARGRNAERADSTAKRLSDTQTALTLIDEIKADATRAGKKVLNADEVQTRLGSNIDILGLQLKQAWQLGTLDNGTVDYLNKLTGGDPTKLDTKGVIGALGIGASSADKTIVKMDAIANSLERAVYNELGQLGVDGYRFRRANEASRPESKAAQSLLDAKTPLEQSAGEERGLAGKVVERVFNPLGDTPTERKQANIEQSGSARFPGLAKEQEAGMDALLRQARGTGDAAKNARAKLVEIAADQRRPALSNATLNILRGEEPQLYAEAVGRLPAEQQQIRTGALVKQGLRVASLESLSDLAAGGDQAATAELISRAQRDPQAFGVLQRVIAARRVGP